MKFGKPLLENGLTRIKTSCGTIIEGVLTQFEEEHQLTYCPTECPLCHKPHGIEKFEVVKRRVPL